MTRWLTVLAACLVAAPAAAQTTSVPKEIVGFKDINIYLVGNAAKCNIKDTKKLASNLKDRLGAIGIKQDPGSVINVSLRVAGDRFGVLSVLCNYSVNLGFEAWLASSNIVNIPPRAKAAIDRLKVLPITLWQGSAFGVTTLKQSMNPDAPGGEDQAEQAAMKGTNSLVERFAELRK